MWLVLIWVLGDLLFACLVVFSFLSDLVWWVRIIWFL